MRLTARDIQVVLDVYACRALRRDQVQRLHFPSRNTANERLKRLYQHRFLQRRWLPVEYGQGAGQAIYLLDRRGADLVAEKLGIPRDAIGWRRTWNQVNSPFLQHRLMVNDIRIAFTLAAKQEGYRVERWLDQDDLAVNPPRVAITTPSGAVREVALIPDAYLVLNLGDRRACFFMEADRGTVPGRRWRERVQAYLAYVRGGGYEERFGSRSLRVVVICTGEGRARSLRRATERVGGSALFWFTRLSQVKEDSVLAGKIWQADGSPNPRALIDGNPPNQTASM